MSAADRLTDERAVVLEIAALGRRAQNDPGHYVKRIMNDPRDCDDVERLDRWQARALDVAVDDYLAARGVRAPGDTTADRDALAASYASFWWAENSGETETWDELDDDEREAVVENSEAETVVDWVCGEILAARPAPDTLAAHVQADVPVVRALVVPSEEALLGLLSGLNVSGLNPEVAGRDGAAAFVASLTDPDADYVNIITSGSDGQARCQHACECCDGDPEWEPTYPVAVLLSEEPDADRCREDEIDPWWTRALLVGRPDASPEGGEQRG